MSDVELDAVMSTIMTFFDTVPIPTAESVYLTPNIATSSPPPALPLIEGLPVTTGLICLRCGTGHTSIVSLKSVQERIRHHHQIFHKKLEPMFSEPVALQKVSTT